MLSKTRKNLQLFLLCFVIYSVTIYFTQPGEAGILSLLFVPPAKGGGMEFKMKIFLEAFVDTNYGDNLFLQIITTRYSQHEFYMLVKEGYEKSYQTLITYIHNIHLVYNDKDSSFLNGMDAMFIVGGDMFGDRFDYSILLKQIHIVKKAGGFVGFMGNSLFEKYSLFTWIDLCVLFSQADIIVVREKETYEQIKKKIPWVNVISMADMVFSTNVSSIKKEPVEEGVLGISVRKKSQVNSEKFYTQYCKEIAQIITQYLEQSKNYKVHLLALSVGKFNDVLVAEDIIKLCSPSDKCRIKCIPFSGNVNSYMREFQKCEKLLCTRFHALVFAVMLRKPFVPIVYEEKMNRLLNEIHYHGIRPNYEKKLDAMQILHSFSNSNYVEDEMVNYIEKATHFFDEVDLCMERWISSGRKITVRTLWNSMLYGIYQIKKYVLCRLYRKYFLVLMESICKKTPR